MPTGIYKHKPHTAEWKEKARKRMMGNKHNTGKKRSIMIRRQISERLKNNPANWKGGIWKNDKNYQSWKKNERNRRKRVAIGNHTFGEWELLKKQYGYKCPCCNKEEPKIKLSEDHIIPLSKGGSDYIENIQPLCKNCNSKKHIKIIKYLCHL